MKKETLIRKIKNRIKEINDEQQSASRGAYKTRLSHMKMELKVVLMWMEKLE
jgi:uncharacterized protein YhbP (UPF0306 family)